MENEGFWAWALGKKNNAMGLLRNRGKALVKQAFRDPAAGVTCWAKKNNAPEVARNTRKTLQNQWYLHVPHHFPQNGRDPLQRASRGYGIIEKPWKSLVK